MWATIFHFHLSYDHAGTLFGRGNLSEAKVVGNAYTLDQDFALDPQIIPNFPSSRNYRPATPSTQIDHGESDGDL